MKRDTHSTWMPILAVCLLALPGCIQVDPLTEESLDRPGAGSRLDGAGSGRVRPPRNYEHELVTDRDVDLPAVWQYDPLPVETLARVKKHMTKKELFQLLGKPDREDAEMANVDSDGNDYTATVYTWRYMDQRHASQPLLREFEVRLAHVDNEREYPHRKGIRGPDWIVMTWDLY